MASHESQAARPELLVNVPAAAIRSLFTMDAIPDLQRLKSRLSLVLFIAALFPRWHSAQGADFQGSTHKVEYNADPIFYSASAPTDPVSLAQKKLKASKSKGWLDFDPQFGYLPAVLDLFNVPAASQMLVFSKTSVQRHDISPVNPRALYFSDSIYIGYIPGAAVLEIASVDPKLGAIFYTVNQDKDEPVRFRRDENCLNCHGAARSMGVPGFVLRSLDTEPSGEPISGSDTENVTHFTPIPARWGGWYVTDAPSDWVHRGNRPGGESISPEGIVGKRVPASLYPKKGSEALPLLVHDHQVHMHNYITRLNFEAQQSLKVYGHLRYLKNQVDSFLRYLLFTEEAPLPSPLPASSAFAENFQARAHRDPKGRSLRDFDLQTHLFKYPCSFLIESEGFQQLPGPLREVILQKLWEILTGQNQEPSFAGISSESRQAVLEIIRAILPDLPDYWQRDGPTNTQ